MVGYNLTSGGIKGTSFSLKVKTKMADKRVGRKPRLGIKATPEERIKLSIAKLGKYRKGCRKVVNNYTGIIYNSIYDAARKCGLHRDTIWKICIGKFKRRDFSYYKEEIV